METFAGIARELNNKQHLWFMLKIPETHEKDTSNGLGVNNRYDHVQLYIVGGVQREIFGDSTIKQVDLSARTGTK